MPKPFNKYRVERVTMTVDTFEIDAQSGEEAKQLVERYYPPGDIVKTETKVVVRQAKRTRWWEKNNG